jgi:hypothetical protein
MHRHERKPKGPERPEASAGNREREQKGAPLSWTEER